MFKPSFSICTRCLRSVSRSYSTTPSNSAAHQPPAAPPPSGLARLSNRRLISIQGPDTPKFLQGILTANVRPSARNAFYAAFLTGTGRVLADVFVYPTQGSQWQRRTTSNAGDGEEGYLIEVDAAHVQGLYKHLKRHKLRAKFSLRVLETQELGVWSLWREGDRWTRHEMGDGEEEGGDGGRGELGGTDSRAPGMGRRVLLDDGGGEVDVLKGEEGVEEVPVEAYTLRRILRGVPEGAGEIFWDESLSMNCNIDLMGGIDFKKGCYVGQELTIRTHHTGVVRRRVLPVMLYDRDSTSAPPEKLDYDPATPLSPPSSLVEIRRDDKRQRATGKFLTGIGNVGLAMCRLEQMSDLVISGEGNSFSPDDRFTVENEQGVVVGIKAFVPDWVRGQIREPKIQRRVE